MIRRNVENFVCLDDYPIVETTEGKYRGFQDGDVLCYRGIPYGIAKRFQKPEAAESFEGVRNAYDYGPVDPGMSYSAQGIASPDNIITQRRLWYRSENCLNLNIWSKLGSAGKKPVMVWLHGGGFAGGSSVDLYSYDGWEMSHFYDVVVVTVNHRLNMSGFLDLSSYGEQYASTGILGMLDLVAALKWINKNIAQFGGNPENVTIYGQSGGGAKVTTLMQMPSADGLYHKAIVQSGVFPANAFSNLSAEVAEFAIKRLGLNHDNIREIETMDYEKLGKAIWESCVDAGTDAFRVWLPIPDGKEYVGNPLDVGFREETKDIPMIVGSCLSEFDEIPQGTKSEYSEEEKIKMLTDKFGGQAKRVLNAYESVYPEMDISYATCVDTMVRSATVSYLNLRTQSTCAPVYNYIFCFESVFMGGQLTGHNGDLHFMFHNACHIPAMCRKGITERLQNEMAGAWASFARTGNPNAEGLIFWPEYDCLKKSCMMFGNQTIVKENHDEVLLKEIQNAYKPN